VRKIPKIEKRSIIVGIGVSSPSAAGVRAHRSHSSSTFELLLASLGISEIVFLCLLLIGSLYIRGFASRRKDAA